MTTSLRLTLVQANPVVGDLGHNIGLIGQAIARNPEAELLVLSECFVLGYPVEDLALRPSFTARILTEAVPEISRLVVAAGGPALLVGMLLPGSGKPYNAAVLFEPSGAIRSVAKAELPNDDVFDEIRTFASAEAARRRPLAFRGWQLGVMICEDMWHGDVARSLADEGADVLVVLNGSPYEAGKQQLRLRHARRRAAPAGLPLVYVNQVGGQDEVVFDGGSFALNGRGTLVAQKAFAEADIPLLLERGPDGGCDLRAVQPLEAHDVYPEELAADYLALTLALRDYCDKNGIPRVFIGESGGLDSALATAIAVDALGPERVVGVRLPTRLTSAQSNDLADELMRRVGCVAAAIEVQHQFTAGLAAIAPAAETLGEQLGLAADHEALAENLQPRLRGMDLMALANALGGMTLATGNKSEFSVGYATLYGDMCGGFAVLKDVWKTRAFALARWRNAHCPAPLKGAAEPIPQAIIDRPPTAELKEGQTDAASLGAYEALDLVLRVMIEEDGTAGEAARRLSGSVADGELAGLINGMAPEAYAARVERLVKAAEFKRRQAPPGVKITARSFGKGRRYPITGRYSL